LAKREPTARDFARRDRIDNSRVTAIRAAKV
jgi:hypothetical protein